MSLWQRYSDEAGYREVHDDDGDEYLPKSCRNDVKKPDDELPDES